MKSLLTSLRHQLSRAGMLENVTPWVEVNVGTDGIARAAVREPINTVQADRLVRAASRVVDLPPGSQIIFGVESSQDEINGEYIVVTTNPVTLIDRAVDLLTGFTIRPVHVRPGYAKLLASYTVESRRFREDRPPPKGYEGREYEPGLGARKASEKIRQDIKSTGATIWRQAGGEIWIGATDKQAANLRNKGYGVYTEQPEKHNSIFVKWMSKLGDEAKFWVLTSWDLPIRV